jgi:hypothetical protein
MLFSVLCLVLEIITVRKTIKTGTMHMMRFEIFTAMRMMMMFWVLAPCRLVSRCQQIYTVPKPRKTTSSVYLIFEHCMAKISVSGLNNTIIE